MFEHMGQYWYRTGKVGQRIADGLMMSEYEGDDGVLIWAAWVDGQLITMEG